MGDSDLSEGEEPRSEPRRGLVVLPAAVADDVPARRRSTWMGRWSILIATLAVGVVAIVLIALLWSGGSGNPDPRSLPPPAAAVLR